MRKLINILAIICFSCLSWNCSNNETDGNEVVQDFTNSDYIKSQVIGKWNYWGHNSPSCNCWIYSGDIHKWYFELKTDFTYTRKSEGTTIQSGTYSITPATSTENAKITLLYYDFLQPKLRIIDLKSLEGKTAIIYESSFDEKYIKE